MHAGFGCGVVGLPSLPLLAIDRRDVDDAAPALFHHVGHDLLGHIEHGVQIGVHHRIPVFTRHLQEHAVLGDAGVVDQHIDGAVLGLCLGEGLDGGIPVAHIANRRVEGIALGLLGVQPLRKVAGGTATGDDLEALLEQTLADRRSDSAHASSDVRDFLTHVSSPLDDAVRH